MSITIAELAVELDVDTRAVGLDVTALCRSRGAADVIECAGSMTRTVLTDLGADLVRGMEGAKR